MRGLRVVHAPDEWRGVNREAVGGPSSDAGRPHALEHAEKVGLAVARRLNDFPVPEVDSETLGRRQRG